MATMGIVAKIQTPADAQGNREDVVLINSTDECVLSDKLKGLPPEGTAGTMNTATDLLQSLIDTVDEDSHTVVNTNGVKPDHACLWYDTRPRDAIGRAADADSASGKCFTEVEGAAK